ncbi:YicS family protein [Pantoea dispersa]|uniref:YicS family protein n=1 Tax=Pantoea dispersa TaxID=59814 RepID=UPI001EE6A6CA|nr:YicS family protein [Pantoea dispersa]UKY36442.1 hypothetical protein KFZ74_19545 [Pantoea dispersa]
MTRLNSVNVLRLPLAGVLLICFSAAGSPLEGAAFALRQQVMINDLRTHCRIDIGVSDEKIRSVFLADPENHRAIIEAADALRAGNREQYAGSLTKIRCPSGL